MKREDTVMSNEQIEKLVQDWVDEDFAVRSVQLDRGHWEYIVSVIAKAQAEISFNAGIREVVNWIEIVPPVTELSEGNMKHYVISIEQWQNKLKEWGI